MEMKRDIIFYYAKIRPVLPHICGEYSNSSSILSRLWSLLSRIYLMCTVRGCKIYSMIDRINLKNMLFCIQKAYGIDSKEADLHSESVFFDAESDSEGIPAGRQASG